MFRSAPPATGDITLDVSPRIHMATLHQIILVCALAGIAFEQVDAALTSPPPPLADLVRDSPLIFHVKSIKTEIPFDADGNEYMRLDLCRVIAAIKTGVPPWKEFFEAHVKTIVFSVLQPRIFGSLEPGKEYVVFCNSAGLAPSIVESHRMFEIEKGSVSVRAVDFPSPTDY